MAYNKSKYFQIGFKAANLAPIGEPELFVFLGKLTSGAFGLQRCMKSFPTGFEHVSNMFPTCFLALSLAENMRGSFCEGLVERVRGARGDIRKGGKAPQARSV